MLNLDDLYKARYVLSKILRRTDLVHAPKLNPESDICRLPARSRCVELIIRFRS